MKTDSTTILGTLEACPKGILGVEGKSTGWSQADEDAQAEAIRTIRMLQARDSAASCRGGLGREDSVEELRKELELERCLRLAAQDQVRCLEFELDNKESAIQVLQTTLEKREQDLQRAQLEVRQFLWQHQDKTASSPTRSGACDYERVRALREQVLELEYQVQIKDMQIERLSGSFKQRRSIQEDELSTLCSSERSTATPSNAPWG